MRNGYKIDITNLQGLTTLMTDIHTLAQPIHDSFFFKKMAEVSCEYLDQSKFLAKQQFVKLVNQYPTEMDTPTPISLAWESIQLHQSLTEQRIIKDTGYDFGFTVSLYPQVDCVLMTVRVEKKEYLDLFNRFPIISSYAYAEDMNKPEKISQEEWEERGKRWKTVIGTQQMEAHLVEQDVNPFAHIRIIQSLQPSWSDRLKAWGVKNAIASKIKEWKSKGYNTEIFQFSTHDTKIRHFLDSTEGKRAYKKQWKLLKKVLPNSYSIDELQTPFLL